MKRIVVGLMAVCLLGSLTVLAGEKAEKKEVVLQDITAAGKLAKRGMDYTVTEADGTVVMVKVMAKKAAKTGKTDVVEPVVDLEKFIGKEVKLVGKGITKTTKAGKTTKTIKTVTGVEEAVAPAAEAPTAATPTAEAPAVEAPAAE